MEEWQLAAGERVLLVRSFYQQEKWMFMVYEGFLGEHAGSVMLEFQADIEACRRAAEGLFTAARVTQLPGTP